MPYIDDNAFEALDLFMTSIGRKRAWDVLKKKLGNKCEEDGCKEAVEQTKINKENIEANATNITQNTTNIIQNKADITQNTTNITQNAKNIAQNTANITQNAENIAQNTENISELKYIVDNLEEVNVDSAELSDIYNLFN